MQVEFVVEVPEGTDISSVEMVDMLDYRGEQIGESCDVLTKKTVLDAA
jgi:hypothetical protein